jgi:hypothetical protein
MTEGLNTLDELLSDPMVQLVMERDSVRPEHLRLMLERARDRGDEPRLPPAHVIDKVCLVKRLCL